MFDKKPKVTRPIPEPVKIQEAEEISKAETYENPDVQEPKKKEQSIEQEAPVEQSTEQELTEEAVKQILTNLTYRIGRIEHHLRLDF